MKLKITPQKDGINTIYDCGLTLTGTWNTRLTQHKEFIESPMGKYIMNLEEENERLDKRDDILTALESAGVDNWSGYEYAFQELDDEKD